MRIEHPDIIGVFPVNRIEQAALFAGITWKRAVGSLQSLHINTRMAREYLRDRYVKLRKGKQAKTLKPRSVRTLAKEASQLVYGNSNESKMQRLRTQFCDDKKGQLLENECYRDDVEEWIEHQVLEEIGKLLQRYHVPMDLAVIVPKANVRPKKSAKFASKKVE